MTPEEIRRRHSSEAPPGPLDHPHNPNNNMVVTSSETSAPSQEHMAIAIGLPVSTDTFAADAQVSTDDDNTEDEPDSFAHYWKKMPRKVRLLSLGVLCLLINALAVAVATTVVVVTRGGDESDPEGTMLRGQEIVGRSSRDLLGRAMAFSQNGSILALGGSGAPNTIGAPFAGTVSVLVYNESRTQWVEFGQHLYGLDEGDRFGDSVAISDDGLTLAVGSPFVDKTFVDVCLSGNATNATSSVDNEDDLVRNVGSVMVFRFNGTSWLQLGPTLYGQAFNDHFGHAVALSSDGRKLAVGGDEEAPGTNGNPAPAGFVQVFGFREAPDEWYQLGRDIKGEGPSDRFGWALDISNDGFTLAVGAHSNGEYNVGHVRVYHFDNMSAFDWIQAGADVDGEDDFEQFGVSVAISGDGMTLLAGAPSRFVDEDSTKLGEARVFRYDVVEQEWEYTAVFLGDDPRDWFGWSVDISSNGKVMVVGASRNAAHFGLVRVFGYDDNDGVWQPLYNFTGLANGQDHGLGYAVALSPDGNYVAVPDDDGPAFCTGNQVEAEDCERAGRIRVFGPLLK